MHLKSGFALKADSHVQQGGDVVFQVGAGTVQFSSLDIELIEVFPQSPAPSVAKAVAVSVTPDDLLARAAAEEALDANLVRSVAKVESGLKQEAISRKGAIGLMQLMPVTAGDLGVDASKAEQNARGGAKYLRALLLQFHGNSALALAAYNAGPAAVAKYNGVPPFSETRQYILRVTREYDSLQKATKNSTVR